MKRITVVVGALVLAGLIAGGAFALGRDVRVPRGGSATFAPSYWTCHNGGTTATCFSGDAHPYVDLTATKSGGLTVTVHTLPDPRAGHLLRTSKRTEAIYTFSAL